MRKLTFILLLMISFGFVRAQSEIDFDQLKKKVEKSNADIQNPKKNIKESTWMDRADLMMEVFDAHRYNCSDGMDLATFKLVLQKQLKNSVQEEQDGVLVDKLITERAIFYFVNNKLEKWEVLAPVVENPLNIAYESLKKAQEIDVNGKKSKKISELYTKLKNLYITDGSNCYSLKNYNCAYNCFNDVINIGSLPILNHKDTAIYYYSALSAQLAGKNQEAIDLYKKAIDLNYSSEGNAYAYIDQCYKAIGDGESGLPYLESGFTKFPKNQNVLIPLINYYLNKNEDPGKVISYVNKAIEDDPQNASLFFAKGTVYDKLNNSDLASEAYNKAIELDPKYFDAYYNLGALIYNKGVKYLEEANKLPAKEIEKYDDLVSKANVEFKKSIPVFEKAYQINPNEKSTIETLKNIYFRYRNEGEEMNKKFQEYNEKLQNLK